MLLSLSVEGEKVEARLPGEVLKIKISFPKILLQISKTSILIFLLLV